MNKDKINNIKFDNIPDTFKSIVIEYIEKLINIKGYDEKYINGEILRSISIFLSYISNLYPQWTDLRKLQRIDIERFLHYFNNEFGHLEQKDRVYLQIIKKYIYHIDMLLPEVAPVVGASSLFFTSDIPKKYIKDRRSQTIPIEVRKQLDSNISLIADAVIRDIVIIARKTGIAIADICKLKTQNCLISVNNKSFMVVDIKASKILEHKIPIDEVCSEILKRRIEYVNSLEVDTELLFFNRENIAIETKDVIKATNKLAKEQNITYMGEVFNFAAQMFRETRAIELINAGMDIVNAQAILGYMDTTMLENYKNANEDKLRLAIEKSQKKLEERKDRVTGKILTKTFIENGECSNIDVKNCYRELNPCLNCKNFYITPEFIDNYKSEIQRLTNFIDKYKNIDNCIIYLKEHYKLLEQMKYILKELEKLQDNINDKVI